jgi:hypothetical protein
MQKTKPSEPLFKLMLKEKRAWQAAWKGGIKEEGEEAHVQLLEEYVQAAARKAVGQLELELLNGLKKALA